MATISLDIAWEGVCVRLATFAPWKPILRKSKNKKATFEETDWRFRFDATHIRNVTVIIFEDCNDEEHVATAVYNLQQKKENNDWLESCNSN